MKKLYLLIALTFFALDAKSQNDDLLKLQAPQGKKYDLSFLLKSSLDSSYVLQDTLAFSSNRRYSLGIIPMSEDGMAPMPKMEMSDDVNYPMRIRKYENYHKPYEPELNFELLPEDNKKNVKEGSDGGVKDSSGQ